MIGMKRIDTSFEELYPLFNEAYLKKLNSTEWCCKSCECIFSLSSVKAWNIINVTTISPLCVNCGSHDVEQLKEKNEFDKEFCNTEKKEGEIKEIKK